MGKPPKPVLLGGRSIPVPVLAGPVGAPDRAYPNINQPEAILQVDAELAKLAELRNPPAAAGGLTPTLLQIANAVAGYRQDRIGAIAGFQQAAKVGTGEERQKRVLLPDGDAWRWLFAYGHIAAALDTARDNKANPRDYVFTGSFDHQKFLTEAAAGLRGTPGTAGRFNTISLPHYDRFLRYMESDGRIVDIRWMAYMFATAYWEGARVVTVGTRPNGKDIKGWETVVPINETGKGETRRYARPVKFEILNANSARITEWDGDIFEIVGGSQPKLITPSRSVSPKSTIYGKTGAEFDAGKPADSAYGGANGTEKTYYGRGYIQLTWWFHYINAGFAIGMGFDLLRNPDLANDPEIAYKIMADGMITGRHYANGKYLSNYIYGATANYTGARAIVNAADKQQAIVDAAKIFENALLKTRK